MPTARRWLPLGALLLAGCLPRPSSESLPVGHLAPLTSPMGQSARQGVALAVAEANQDPTRRVEVLHADAATADAAHLAAVRLITVNRVAVLVGGHDAAHAAALLRAAQPYTTTLIHTSGWLPPTGSRPFTVGLSPPYVGTLLARYVGRDRGVAHAALVTDSRNPAALALAEAFPREFRKQPGTTLTEAAFATDAALVEVAPRVACAGAGIVVFVGSAADLMRFRKALREAGGTAPVLYAGEDDGRSALLEEDTPGPALVATAFAPEAVPDGEFVRRYREQHGQAPDLAAALGHDALRLAAEVGRLVRASPGTRLREALTGLESFETVTGPLLRGRDHAGRPPLFVLQVESREAKLLKRFDPEK